MITFTFFLKCACSYPIIFKNVIPEVDLNGRLQTILDYLQKHGFSAPDELARFLEVSAITIRRDFAKLEEQGMLKRVHGGAVPIQTPFLVPHVAARLRQHAAAKRAIAKFAAGLIKPDEKIFLDAGSTCCYLAECLPEDLNLTVITHSFDNVNILKQKKGLRVICIGGELDENLNAFVGTLAEVQLSQFFVNKAFIATAGIAPEYGCVNNTVVERNIKLTMNRQAKEAYILADSSKFGVKAFHKSMPFSEIKSIVTDRRPPGKIIRTMRKAGVRILCVS